MDDFGIRLSNRIAQLPPWDFKESRCLRKDAALALINSSGFHSSLSLAEGLRRRIRYEFVERHNGDLFYTERPLKRDL